MSMVEITYTSRRTGQTTVYVYAPPERDNALKRCRRTLACKGKLHLIGKARWRSGGPQSRLFQNDTVQQLIAKGEAVRHGDVIRAAEGV